jgi:hypothetical protein
VRSGSGSCSIAVDGVAVSEPKNGTVVLTPQSNRGSMLRKWIATVSPGSAPSIQNGPLCGFR